MYMIRRLSACLALLVLVAATPTHAQSTQPDSPTGALQAPFARVPKMQTRPKIVDDHNVGRQWLQATAFCGLRNAQALNQGNLPKYIGGGFDASWWLGYDDENLYIAALVRLPKNEGQGFLAKTTEHQDINILHDDHIEMQLSFETPDKARAAPFFKLMVNPAGAVWVGIHNWLPGQTKELDPRQIELANTVTSDAHAPGRWWVTKMAIPREMLATAGIEKLAGREGRMFLAYSSGFFFGSWGGTRWKSWDEMGRVVFDPAPPATAQVNGAYPAVLNRKGALSFTTRGRFQRGDEDNPMRVEARLSASNNGKQVWQRTLTAKGVGNEPYRLTSRDSFPTADMDNLFRYEVVAIEPDGKETLLLRNALPFDKRNPELEAQIKQWSEAHEKSIEAQATYDYIYSPYNHKLDAMVDTDIPLNLLSGDQAERGQMLASADTLRAAVRDASGRTIAQGETPLEDQSGNTVMRFDPPLAEGKYTVAFELLRDGEVIDTSETELVREKFAWEKNDIGRQKVVIPPFDPVEADGQTLRVWGRDYAMKGDGFPASINSRGADVLGGPMRLSGTVAGQSVTQASDNAASIELVPGKRFPEKFAAYEFDEGTSPEPGVDFELPETDGYAARVEAQSRVGKLPVRVSGELGYDGFYRVNLTLDPSEPTRVDDLTLTIPISDNADLFRFHRQYTAAGLGAIPEGDGVLFSSDQMPAVSQLQTSFVPMVFVGEYDRGLFWMAESDRGWVVDEKTPLVQLVREDGQLALKLRIVSKPATIEKPREIEFALLATPARPKPAAYRRVLWEGDDEYSHDTAGFRFYGRGVNGFGLYKSEDYEGLRKFYYEMGGVARRYRDLTQEQLDKLIPKHKHDITWRVRTQAAIDGGPLIVYGSTFHANPSMDEFDTFGSAWIQSAFLERRYQPAASYKWVTSESLTYQWTTDEQLTTCYTPMDQSYIDCQLWHMTRIAEKVGINGHFHDNYQTYPSDRMPIKTDITGVGYRRPDGQIQPYANPLRMHQWNKRWATALWMMGRPPMHLKSNDPDNTFGPTWFVEGMMYHPPQQDWIEAGLSLDKWAAFTASTSGMAKIATRIYPVMEDGQPVGVDETIPRLALAFGLLHDKYIEKTHLRAGGMSDIADRIHHTLRDEVGFYDPDTQWVRYWRNGELLDIADASVKVGGYVGPGEKPALLIAVNPTEQAATTTVSVKPALLGEAASAITRADTGETLAEGHEVQVSLPPHGVEYLLVR